MGGMRSRTPLPSLLLAAAVGLPAVLALLARPTALVAAESGRPELVESRKIWDAAPHNAFTDLVWFKGAWFCSFREGKAHVSPDGAVRVITSADGEKWESAARLTRDGGADLRDPKLALAPDGRLMLTAVAAFPASREAKKGEKADPADVRHRSMVWFSADGKDWGEGKEVADPNFWLWRPAWHGDACWGVGYTTDPDRPTRFARLYSSRDGLTWGTAVDKFVEEGSPNEAALLFDKDDTALCLIRRETGKASALLGASKPPYKEWTWKDLGARIGGPVLTRLPDGRLVAVVRLYDKKVRTAVCQADPDAGTLTELLALPSGGDTSYAGVVFHEGLLWVSYYSSHEGKTSIYLAKVRLPAKA